MKEEIESKIRRNAFLLYGIVALVALGMIIYIYHLRNNIKNQKHNIEHQNHILSKTNELIYTVQQAQSLTNAFISSRNRNFIKEHHLISLRIDQLIDSLNHLSGNTTQASELSRLAVLLVENRIVVEELNKQFLNYNPLDSIRNKIEYYTLNKEKDTALLVVTKMDTAYTMTTKKNFWQRLSNLFSPKKYADTVISLTTSRTDTFRIAAEESGKIINDVDHLTRQASDDYTKQMTEIKKQVEELIFLEQDMANEISALLIGFHQGTLDSIMHEINESEKYIRKNYLFLLIGEFCALGLILILLVLIIRNVNKGYTARKELEKANQIIKRAMDERHQLLLSVSHDIKAPLTSILGYLELYQTDKILAAKLEGLSSMRTSGRYILSLLDNLLGFSSLERGTLKLTTSHFKLKDLFVEVAEMISPLAIHRGLKFDYHLDFPSGLCIGSDRMRLKQIVINLLTNSVKYTLSGFVNLKVGYCFGSISITVEDSGTGIPKERMEDIFEPFSRIENNKTLANGSGFGLYVVKGLIAMFKGELELNSEVGIGTRAMVTIPATESESEDCISSEDTSEPPLLTKDNAQLLLIDDDIMLLTLMKRAFLSLGHTVTLCANLSELEAALNSLVCFDMVITDMEMGAFSGKDVLHRIKSSKLPLPVVVMTARDDYNSEKALKEGFVGCIKKPFSIAKLSHLFSKGTSLSNHTKVAGSDNRFSLLSELFDGNPDTINHILSIFVETTDEKLRLLKKALWMDNFEKARFLSHQMLSSFSQIGESEELGPLKKIDAYRNSYSPYPEWKKELETFIIYAEELLDMIRTDYLNE